MQLTIINILLLYTHTIKTLKNIPFLDIILVSYSSEKTTIVYGLPCSILDTGKLNGVITDSILLCKNSVNILDPIYVLKELEKGKFMPPCLSFCCWVCKRQMDAFGTKMTIETSER